jgi:branched-chain amino acid transport system permease protein
MRATAENPRVAALMGVKPDVVISATFVIGAVLAAIAGIMLAMNYGTVQHAMGFLPGLKAFTAAVFGGIGNLAGAVVGGIVAGLDRGLWARATSVYSPVVCWAATTPRSSPSSC